MRLEQISEHVYQLRSWVMLPINVWLIKEEDGITLIDGGIKMMAKGIIKAVDKIGAGPIRRILLTHGHSDHVGAIEALAENYGVPVYAHQNEIPYATGKLPYPGRKKAQELVKESLLKPLPMDGKMFLTAFGTVQPYATPGHTPGHTVYLHKEDNIILCGDLYTNKGGKLNRPMPMFTSDMEMALKSGKIVNTLKPRAACICHGKQVIDPIF